MSTASGRAACWHSAHARAPLAQQLLGAARHGLGRVGRGGQIERQTVRRRQPRRGREVEQPQLARLQLLAWRYD